MPINRLLAESKLGPDEIESLNLAFKQALRSLHLVDRNDPLTELVARKIIEISATGVRDAKEIADNAVKQSLACGKPVTSARTIFFFGTSDDQRAPARAKSD